MIWGIVNGVWGHHTNVSLRDMILKQRTGSTLAPDSLPHAASHPLDPNLTPFMLCPRDPYFILLPDPRPQLRGLLCPLASDWVWPVEVGGLGRAWPGSSLCSQSSSGPHEPARVPLCSLFLWPFPTLPFLVSAFFFAVTDSAMFYRFCSLYPTVLTDPLTRMPWDPLQPPLNTEHRAMFTFLSCQPRNSSVQTSGTKHSGVHVPSVFAQKIVVAPSSFLDLFYSVFKICFTECVLTILWQSYTDSS